jgi:hypothetical protein
VNFCGASLLLVPPGDRRRARRDVRFARVLIALDTEC